MDWMGLTFCLFLFCSNDFEYIACVGSEIRPPSARGDEEEDEDGVKTRQAWSIQYVYDIRDVTQSGAYIYIYIRRD